MGRAWRIEYEGALYHLMSRGNDGQHIYLNDVDRNLFLETISEMSERFEVDIFAYVLMSNLLWSSKNGHIILSRFAA